MVKAFPLRSGSHLAFCLDSFFQELCQKPTHWFNNFFHSSPSASSRFLTRNWAVFRDEDFFSLTPSAAPQEGLRCKGRASFPLRHHHRVGFPQLRDGGKMRIMEWVESSSRCWILIVRIRMNIHNGLKFYIIHFLW